MGPARSRGPGLVRGRWADGVLAAGVLCLAGAAAYRVAPASDAPRTRATPSVGVVRPAPPRPSPARVLFAPEGRAGRVAFELPEPGSRVAGVLTARVFPERDGAIAPAGACDATWSQEPDGVLDLRPWLADARASGPHLLQFSLRVVGDDAEGVWLGWARFDPLALLQAELRVSPLPGETAVIEVRLASGAPVPGALVALTPVPLPPTALATLVYTGGDGRCRVRGISPETDWRVQLPDGLGPSREPVEERLAPGARRVVLRAPLPGRWRFVRHAFELPLPGAAVQLGGSAQRSTPAAAWPVSRWIGPGRGPRTPFHVMVPDLQIDAPAPLVLAVEQFPASALPDARVPTVFRFSAPPAAIELRPLSSAPR